MRSVCIIALINFCISVYGQINVPKFTIRQDSATHTTVMITDGVQFRKIKTDKGVSPLIRIEPQIKIKTGTVDYKNLTGEIFVREYYLDSMLLGYVEYDGSDMKRELYYNAQGKVYLEKRYEKGKLEYVNDKVETLSPASLQERETHP